MNKEDSIKKLEFEKKFGSIKKFEDESGYRSPIELIYSDIQMKLEDNVCEAVQSVGVNVDKDELIKALQYDREQYAKGFADGYTQGIEDGKKCENCANCSPWDGYCGLGNNEEARDRGVCERWESK